MWPQGQGRNLVPGAYIFPKLGKGVLNDATHTKYQDSRLCEVRREDFL